MLKFITDILNNNIIKTIISRLCNRYTSSGIALFILAAERLGLLPDGSLELVQGLPANEVFIWAVLAIALYFICKKVK